MLQLKTLKFSGIGRFVEEQTIDFTQLGSLVQLDGLNRNTNGSSGAGKSTVFNALDFLLGLNDLPNTTLQSRVTKNGISVTGEFAWDDKELVIKRTKKGLSIKIGADDPIEGSSKLAEEKLDEILAMPRNLFRQILHKRQKEGGFFLNLTPKQTHDFLTDSLELGAFRVKLMAAEKKAKEIELTLVDRTTELVSVNSFLKATQDAQASLGTAPTCEVTRESILELKRLVDDSETVMNELNRTHVAESNTLALLRPQVNIKPFDRSQIEQLEAKLRDLGKRAEQLSVAEQSRQTDVSKQLTAIKVEKVKLDNLVAQGTRAHQDAVAIASEIKRIRENICPTCEQHWNTESSKTKESSLLDKVKALKDVIAAGKKAEEDLVPLKLRISELEPMLRPQKIEGLDVLLAEQHQINEQLKAEREKEKSHQGSEVAKSRALMDEHNKKCYELQNKQLGEAQVSRNAYNIAKSAFDSSVAKFKAFDEAKKRFDFQSHQLNDKVAKYSADKAQLEEKIKEIESERDLAQEAQKVIKSFISCSFDDSLEYISEVATRMIRSIPNMANATIQLEGVKETKAGSVKEEVNAVINMDGEEGVPIKSLSGGERTAVDLGIDFAVIDLIENRTSKGIDIFILDEPFNGLDTPCVEMALELLRNTNLNKKVFIVDHNPEVKQMVQSRVLVTRDGEQSTVSQS